jgi:hypothetical protein
MFIKVVCNILVDLLKCRIYMLTAWLWRIEDWDTIIGREKSPKKAYKAAT